ncbi:hypothetical protein [Nocardia africana]
MPRWPTQRVLDLVEPGDGGSWEDELAWLWSKHAERMTALIESVIENGICEHIQIGITTDYEFRMWDGHHRVAAAVALGLPEIPVILVLERTVA